LKDVVHTDIDTRTLKRLLKIILALGKKTMVTFMVFRKINMIRRAMPERHSFTLDRDLEARHKQLWKKYGRINNCWLKTYMAISGITDYRYVPEDIYYNEIEPRLNDSAFSKVFTDKSYYHKMIPAEILPRVIIRSVSGILYDEHYRKIKKTGNDEERVLNGNNKFVIKPSIEGGGGYEVRVVEFIGDKIKITPSLNGVNDINNLFSYYKRDFIIQEFIEQHSFFRQFNPDSLNTIRILTYRSLGDERIKILHKILRIGRPGSVVDNQASGGIACGIREDGNLNGFGIDKYGRKYNEINSISISGLVPGIKEVCRVAEKIAELYLRSRLLGMDFAYTNTGKVFLIEVNDSSNEINFYQMNNGPLFGDYSEEVAIKCLNEPKSFLIDFYLK
jgi:hypothetical protein